MTLKCVSCDIFVYHLGLFVFVPRVFFSSRVTGACPVTTDLIMRLHVRTTSSLLCDFAFHGLDFRFFRRLDNC